MSISIIAPYEITLATGLEFYPSAGSPLVTRLIAGDEFGATTQQDLKTGGDGAKSYGWNILNSANADAVDVNITNAGYLTIDCNATYTQWLNAAFTGVYVYKNITGDFDVETLLTGNETTNYHRSAIIARDPAASAGEDWFGIHRTFVSPNDTIGGWDTVNSVTSGTTSDVVSTAKYLRMTRIGNVFTAYYKVNVGDSWTQKSQVTRADFASSIQIGLASATANTGNTYIAKFDYARGFGYLTTSPVATHKFSIPGASIADIVDCLNYLENSYGGTGSLSYGYQLNGGTLVSGQTLAQLKAAVRNATITVHTDSLIVYVSHVSNGSQQVESAIKMGGGLHVVDPVAAGGNIYCLID